MKEMIRSLNIHPDLVQFNLQHQQNHKRTLKGELFILCGFFISIFILNKFILYNFFYYLMYNLNTKYYLTCMEFESPELWTLEDV